MAVPLEASVAQVRESVCMCVCVLTGMCADWCVLACVLTGVGG